MVLKSPLLAKIIGDWLVYEENGERENFKKERKKNFSKQESKSGTPNRRSYTPVVCHFWSSDEDLVVENMF